MPRLLAILSLIVLIAGYAGAGCGQASNEPPYPSSKGEDTTGETRERDPKELEEPTLRYENCFDLFKADADGHDWANTYLLALACQYSYAERLGVSPDDDVPQFEKRFKEKFTPWGIDIFDFVYGSGPGYDTELVVMSKRDGNFVIVIFRGSEQMFKDPVGAFKDNFLTDIDARWADVSEFLGLGVKTHAGFWNAFFPVRDAVKEAIERQGGLANKKLWITGNSLGAALANLCAAWLRNENHSVQGVYTYGAPRCGNDIFRKRYEEELAIMCQRWVNDNDIVPMLPPNGELTGYHHVGVINNIRKDGSVALNDTEHKGVGNPLDHYMEFYAYRIYNNLPQEMRSKMPPPPSLPKVVRPFI